MKLTKIFFILFSISAVAQVPSPIATKHNKILLQNGFTHIGNAEVLSTASIGIENDKIVFVKNSLTTEIVKSEWDTIIDLQGQHVYPGFIAPNVTGNLIPK